MATAPAPTVHPHPSITTTSLVWWRGAVVGLLVAAYLAMSEIDRLVGQVLDDHGRTWTLIGLTSPATVFDNSGWTAQGFTNDQHHLYSWMVAYLLVDAVFIACYALILSWLLGWTFPVLALAALDVLEDIAIGAYGRPSGLPEWVASVVAGTSFVKWLAIGLVVAVVIRRLTDIGPSGVTWRAGLRRLRRALYIHRYSVLPLVPVVALGLVPGPNILDQLPDIQRQWVDGPLISGQAVAATLVLVVLAAGLFTLGRLRSQFALERATDPPTGPGGDVRPAPVLWIYGLGPALVVVGVALNGFADIQWTRLGPFVGVPLLVLALSAVMRARGSRGDRPPRRGLDPEDIPVITLTGDLLAVLILVVGGLALVRSFTAVVTLWSTAHRVTALVLLIVGTAGATSVWWLAIRVIDAVMTHTQWLSTQLTVGDPAAFDPALKKAALGSWLAVFLGLNLMPLAAARLGVIACILLALTSLSLLVGSCVVITQEGGAPDVLWRVGARSAPLSLLLAGALVLGSLWAGDGSIHGTRNLTDQNLPDRIDLTRAFTQWHEAPGCTITDGSVKLRPMFVLAAEGGGIRAAYWTSAALDRIVTHSPCATSSTLVSSGASGGAVGLTVARFAPPGKSSEQVTAMADPTALAAASIGLSVRDLLYSATGVPAPAWGSAAVSDRLRATGNDRWADRAALIEAVWQTESSALDTPFLTLDSASSAPTGQLVLNSTSVGTGCRMLVSQVDYPRTPSGTDCADGEQPVAGSVDLLGAYAPQSTSSGQQPTQHSTQHCVGPVASSTAAMFASRFPFVTPSGVIGPCGSSVPSTDALVDGGYVENTGIGTLVDLAPQWMSQVRDANTTQLRTAKKPEVIVPVLVYLDNGTGSDLRPPVHKATAEPLVPLTASGRAGTQQSDTPTLLQRAATLIAPTRLWDSDACDRPAVAGHPSPTREETAASTACEARLAAAATSVALVRPQSAFVIHESTRPSVTAPLGWTLSQDSIDSMEGALDTQASSPCAGTPTDLLCDRGYGSLADLYALLDTKR